MVGLARMRMEKLLTTFVTTGLLFGCAATLEQFLGMGPYDRALVVCDNSSEARSQKIEIKTMAASVSALSSDIALRRNVLDRGYKIHSECSRQYRTKLVCEELNGGRVECLEEKDPSDWVGKEVCTETPVAIDAAYEEKKLEDVSERLDSSKMALSNLKSAYQENREQCYRRAEQLSPEDAYEHYKNQSEPSNNDVFYRI